MCVYVFKLYDLQCDSMHFRHYYAIFFLPTHCTVLNSLFQSLFSLYWNYLLCLHIIPFVDIPFIFHRFDDSENVSALWPIVANWYVPWSLASQICIACWFKQMYVLCIDYHFLLNYAFTHTQSIQTDGVVCCVFVSYFSYSIIVYEISSTDIYIYIYIFMYEKVDMIKLLIKY